MDATGFEAPRLTATAQLFDDRRRLAFMQSKIAEGRAMIEHSRQAVASTRLGIALLDLMLFQMGQSSSLYGFDPSP